MLAVSYLRSWSFICGPIAVFSFMERKPPISVRNKPRTSNCSEGNKGNEEEIDLFAWLIRLPLCFLRSLLWDVFSQHSIRSSAAFRLESKRRSAETPLHACLLRAAQGGFQPRRSGPIPLRRSHRQNMSIDERDIAAAIVSKVWAAPVRVAG